MDSMKPIKQLMSLLVIAGIGLAVTANCEAQTLQLLLPGPATDSAPTGTGQDLLINPFNSDPAPSLFLALGSVSAGAASIYRLTPTDAASSNFTIEPVDNGLAYVSRLAYKPGDGLYAVGYSVATTGTKGRTQSTLSWKVRRSPLAGQGNLNSWADDDNFNLTSVTKGKTTTFDARASGLTTDDLGSIYVCGMASDGRVGHWVIRRKTGSIWSRVLDLPAADSYSIPYSIRHVPAGRNNPIAGLFVVGIFNDRWTVLRSRDQGTSWQAVGPWPTDGSLASAQDLASDSHGNIYVAGVRGRDRQNRGWVLRMSDDGGDHWQDLLDQPSTNDSWVWRLSIDAFDKITLAGNIDGATGSPRWAVVRNAPGQAWSGTPTASWESRFFPFGEATSPSSKGRGTVSDAFGNLFLTGDLDNWTDADGVNYPGTRVGLLRLVP
jgi:hypothetical protein